MESIIIISVALAILTQSSCAQQSPVYELSEVESAQFRGIIDNQDKTFLAYLGTSDLRFDVLEKLTAKRKFNLQSEADNFSKALLQSKSATSNIFNSISLIMGGACTAAETAQNAAHADLENAYVKIKAAIELASSGNYTDIRTQFEVSSVETKASSFTKRFYDTIRTCLNITDADTLAVIKVRENGSTNGLIRVNNAFFDAVKVVAANIPAEKSGVTVVPDIKVYRKRTRLGVRDFVENMYSPIRGLFITTQLNRPQIAARVISDQYAQIASDSRYKDGTVIIFDVVEGYLKKVQLGLSDGCSDDSFTTEAARAESSEYYQAALRVLVESVPTPDLLTTSAAKAGLKFFNAFTDDAAVAYYSGIKLARGEGSTYPETLVKIQTVETGLRTGCTNFVRTIFNLIQLGSSAAGGEINNYQDRTIVAVLHCVEHIFDGIRVMAKACHGVEPVSADDFDSLQTSRDELNYGVGNFTSSISSGHLLVIKSLSKSIQSAIPTLPSIVASKLPKIGTSRGFNLG